MGFQTVQRSALVDKHLQLLEQPLLSVAATAGEDLMAAAVAAVRQVKMVLVALVYIQVAQKAVTAVKVTIARAGLVVLATQQVQVQLLVVQVQSFKLPLQLVLAEAAEAVVAMRS